MSDKTNFRKMVLANIDLFLSVKNHIHIILMHNIDSPCIRENSNYVKVKTLLSQDYGNLGPLDLANIISAVFNEHMLMQLVPTAKTESASQPAEVNGINYPSPPAEITFGSFKNILPDKVKLALKPHQVDGLKFLYERIISEKKGAIIAHNMGLGKTLTALSFTFGYSKCFKEAMPKILIVAPVNSALQWKQEYGKWFGGTACVAISAKTADERIQEVTSWLLNAKQNILIIGYEKFAAVMKDYNGLKAIQSIKLIIFDEAHKLKNAKTKIHEQVQKLETLLKIFLTGTPVQNNVMEYFTIVDLTEPDLLGDRDVFKEEYFKPIENGKASDAERKAVMLRKQKCQEIYNMTKNIMHRKSASILMNIEKFETTIMLCPTEVQKQMITKYIDEGIKVALVDRNNITYILNHPYVFSKMRDEYDLHNRKRMFELSNKIMILLELIKYCEKVGDKLLVFSSSIATLDYIEYVLKCKSDHWFNSNHSARENKNSDQWAWKKGSDYERIDGKTKKRLEIQNKFSKNPQLRLMLFSTIAGSLGANFQSANRVVIFDLCWNPFHDIQSLFRVCRLD